VLDGLATLLEREFGIHLEPHPERVGWHPTCRPFDMVDVASGRVLAHLFIDPHARPGKQAGAWLDILAPGGGRHGEHAPATLGLMLNAPAPDGGPVLLTAWDVETAFHEYGHAMNFACETGRFAVHRESWVPFDFVEGPSEFVGLWSVQPDVVSRFARHHETGEAIPRDLVEWTDGRAVVATGSPFAPVVRGGVTHPIGQGNNAFIFPGVGFGAILSEAREITDNMVLAAAYALADFTAQKCLPRGDVYPAVDDLNDVSMRVATRVIEQAFDDGVAQTQKVTREKAADYVRARFWKPRYMPIVRG